MPFTSITIYSSAGGVLLQLAQIFTGLLTSDLDLGLDVATIFTPNQECFSIILASHPPKPGQPTLWANISRIYYSPDLLRSLKWSWMNAGYVHFLSIGFFLLFGQIQHRQYILYWELSGWLIRKVSQAWPSHYFQTATGWTPYYLLPYLLKREDEQAGKINFISDG